MKIFDMISIVLVLFPFMGVAQDLPLFEVADNVSLGLVPVLLDRWGCTVTDIDRNGWPDIYNNKWRGVLESQIYMNQDGYFTDIYSNSPELKAIEMQGNATRTPVLVDFDNDGDRDLMIGFDKSHHMFRNDNGVFVDITSSLGIVSKVPGFVSIYSYEMSAWTDFDLDGDLDALVFQTNNPSFIFYRNDGNKFVDIAAEVGLANVLPLGNDGDRGYYTGRLQWVDYDKDGDPDISAGYLLFRNDNGIFTEISASIGFTPYPKMWFTDWFDFDNDGDLDFFAQSGAQNRDELWMNDNGTFVDVTQDLTLDLFNNPNQACFNIGDLDNDSDQDVFVQINDWTGDDIDALLLNDESATGQRSLVDIAQFVNMTMQGDRKGSAIFDYDMDGRLDIYIPSQDHGSIMYQNWGTETPNHWVGFDLWGTKSNKDALGSWITLYAGGKSQVRYTKAATTWKVQDNPYVHFGIGQKTSVDSVVIRWPLGNVQVLKNVAIDQYHKIVEPTGSTVAEKSTTLPDKVTLAQNYPNPFNPETMISYHLTERSAVLLQVYNLAGQKVTTLIDGYQNAGPQEISWKAVDNLGRPVPSGIYLYRLQVNNLLLTKKMMLVR